MSPRTKTLRLLTLAGLALIAGVWVWMADDGQGQTPAAAQTEVPMLADTEATLDEPSTSHPSWQSSAPQFPPVGRPMHDDLSSLMELADAGDANAACRLSVQLLSCQTSQAMFLPDEAELAEKEQTAQTEGRHEDADQLASILLRLAEQRSRCAGVSNRSTERASGYLRQAALAGEPEAMARYVSGHGLGPHTDSRYITSEHFEHWRREALPMLERLLADGRPEAVLLLLEAHSTNSLRLSMLVPADPVTSIASLALAQRVFGDRAALGELQMADGLDAARRSEAEALAAEMHERHFDNRRHEHEPAARLLSSLFDPYGLHSWPIKGSPMDPRRACPPAAGEGE